MFCIIEKLEFLEVGVRQREEGCRGREDPGTRGEDERVSGGRKSSSGGVARDPECDSDGTIYTNFV